jgi:arylsulfatase
MTMSDRPNVLLICTDHWAGGYLGCADHPAIVTPTLNQLAANGVRFPNAYTDCPICVAARRSLMTGLSPTTHGSRSNSQAPMPTATVAQTFRDAGYQAYCVGKLHTTPYRNRIGFDDVILDEEARMPAKGQMDDYEIYLAEQGFAGKRFSHGLANNDYLWAPWHLPDEHHVTEWAGREMTKMIKRRNTEKPSFWYLSFAHPHPPLQPLQRFWEIYQDAPIPDATIGDWAKDQANLPTHLQARQNSAPRRLDWEQRNSRRAFYALCTQIDYQVRQVIGALRDEGIINNTIILFTSDHGDMLGDHGLWAKNLMYDKSACVPMILSAPGDERVGHHRVDSRLVKTSDIMPTLLDLAGIDIPECVEGKSMLSDSPHEWVRSEIADNETASRMIRKGDWKLVYYPASNYSQLFHMVEDPLECHNRAQDSQCSKVLQELESILVSTFTGTETEWAKDGKLIGVESKSSTKPGPNHTFSNQRGYQVPPPPAIS